MELITTLFGRFHPLLVHLPIGILFLAFFFEFLSARKQNKRLSRAVQPALLWGSVFALAAAITGWLLRQEGGYEERVADLHQNLGIATVILCLGVYYLRRKMKQWVSDPVRRKQLRISLFIPLIFLLSLTGHWGGSLTHGEDYLFAALSMEDNRLTDPTVKLRTIEDIGEASLYPDVIQPILEARCYDCHSSTKQKGELRLDHVDFIRRGGKNGKVIGEGPADSSTLFRRLMLPLEDDKHMPPSEKPQLSSSEIALIKYWIEEDAPFEKPVARFAESHKIQNIIRSLQEAPQESWVPSEPVEVASDESLAQLSKLGVNAMPVSVGNEYLMVSFAGFQEVTDQQLGSLQAIRDQLVWLNLGHTRIRDEQLPALAALTNLRVLYLNNTPVTDDGLVHLSGLAQLRWLSVVNTGVSDASLPVFERLNHLSTVFLYNTSFTAEAFQALARNRRDLRLDTGNYELPKLPTDTIVYKRGS